MKVEFFGRMIDTDDIYFICYSGEKREGDFREYYAIKNLPDVPDKFKMLAELDSRKNPYVLPVTGKEMITMAKERKMIPQFDKDFDKTHKIVFIDAGAIEFYLNYSARLKIK